MDEEVLPAFREPIQEILEKCADDAGFEFLTFEITSCTTLYDVVRMLTRAGAECSSNRGRKAFVAAITSVQSLGQGG